MSSITSTEEPAAKKAKTVKSTTATTAEVEGVVKALRGRLEEHDNNRKEVQEKLHETCEVWMKEIDDLEEKANNKVEEGYAKESEDLQKVLDSACGDKDRDKDRILSRLEECDNKRREAQEKAEEKYGKMRKEIDELEDRINNELREKFTAEDSRLQTTLSELRTEIAAEADDGTPWICGRP